MVKQKLTVRNKVNALNELFLRKKRGILSVYFTAGYPGLNDTNRILQCLEKEGVDLVEIGMPYSDPLADGKTIQASGQQALRNGMTLEILFEQLRSVVSKVNLPIVLMGYLNPVEQMGWEKFCENCASCGVSGLIIPDLPPDIYQENHAALFEKHGLSFICLVTPQTDEARIRKIAAISSGFLYVVSTAGTTGGTKKLKDSVPYFEKLEKLKLNIPQLVGFNIRDKSDFKIAARYTSGAIVGSAFIQALSDSHKEPASSIHNFIKKFKA